MNAYIKHIKQDRILLIGFVLALACTIVSLGMLLLFYQMLPPVIPIFNQFTWGDTRLGSTIQFFIPVGFGLFVTIINSILSHLFYNKMPLLSRILALTALVVGFFVLLFVLRTLQLIL